MKKIILLSIIIAFTNFAISQIIAPSAETSFSTNYSSQYLAGGGQNDLVFVFCSDETNNAVGELQVSNAGGCTVTWFVYDGLSYSALGQVGSVATGLTSGLYMAQVNCSGTITCYKAWVWVNQTYVHIDPIEPGCETFTLNAQVNPLDTEFHIIDPPGIDFEIDENTYIQICFWANHTYVSDLGFYLKAPGATTLEPGNDGVVALLPSASDWGLGGAFQSNTTIPWAVTGCAPEDEGTNCNDGNHLDEFCFSTNYWLGGPELTPGNPAHVPCICDLPVPLQGVYAPAESWERIYGYMAGDPGWAVQIYDCQPVDYGALTMARLVFSAQTSCGQTTFVYDSDEIYSVINDNSCAANTASIYVVPSPIPPSGYTVTSSITSHTWSCTGSGFTGNQLSHQIVKGTADYPHTTSDFVLTVKESINAPGSPKCTTVKSETFFTLPSDATITPVGPVCANDAPFQLQAVDGGGIWTTNAPENSIINNIFYPGTAGGGTWNISYNIGGPCPDSDQISVVIYETVSVTNFSDNVCDGTGDYYTVSFNVVNNQGNPATFFVDYGQGQQTLTGNFSHQFPSQTSYSITVSDVHDCSEYVLNGYRNCGCTTFAGTISPSSPLQLCVGECTNTLSHNNNAVLDANDMLEYVLHDGNIPPTIYAYNATKPEFCYTDIPIEFRETGTVFYISALAGNNNGGHVDTTDVCLSLSMGIPVVWHPLPVAHIAQSSMSVCGLTAHLVATEPETGSIGTWTANGDFLPLGGQTINSNELDVLKEGDYGQLTFTWTVVDGVCSASDNIIVYFNEQPNAYAGADSQVCGNEIELNAILSHASNSGYWSGNGSFEQSSNPTTTVLSTGTQVFTWREENGECWDEDQVTITFIPNPQPFTTPNVDTVCGNTCWIKVFNVTGTGSWKAYHNGTPISPLFIGGNNQAEVQVSVSYGASVLSYAVDFVWTEKIMANGLECTNTATKRVVFARQPVAVADPNQFEICGNCVTLTADVTGSSWATGFWSAKDVILESYDDLHNPTANVCINPLSSFGDSAQVEVEFLWVVKNPEANGCSSIDTAWVKFYQRPQANAGLDKIVCGPETDLQAYWSFPPNPSYTPDGIWSTVPKPGATADIDDLFDPNSHVSVSLSGIWRFVFRENNANYNGCYSTDTVQIEFVETPIPFAGEDKHVCGKCVTLEATSGGFSGTWLPNGAEFDNTTDPHTNACVAAYDTIVFIWQEANPAITDPSFSCVAADAVNIIFWRVPSANILTDIEDSTVCGLTYYGLRSELQGTGITGYWYNYNSGVEFGDKFANNTWVKVPHYGYYDFYWIEQTGPNLIPGFCNDTAGPLRIHFIETPIANGGGDTLFCGLTGNLNAIPSVGTSTGTWSKPTTANITFADKNDPNTQITAAFNNTAEQPYYELIWTEDNTNDCTDRDTIKVTFARVPNSDITIIPPKCFGEPATIAAVEDSLAKYTWNFYTGILDSSVNNIQHGARYLNFVRWTGKDTIHRISLVAESSLGCQSPVTVDTVYEPSIPDFDHIIVNDTCLLGKGGLIFEDTLGSNVFFWLDPDYGPNPGDAVTAVYNLPEGDYRVATSYMSPNIQHYEYYSITFGTTNCLDTLTYTVDPIGVIQAIIDVDPQMIYEELVAPNAKAIFINRSDYDDIRRRCEWHFDDGTAPQKTCDSIVEHIYTKSGCYEPFLIVMNRDLPECRDTARLKNCILVEQKSEIEVPNIFSPNGDGINDFFQVKAQTLKEFKGVITNRWGRKVYEWTDWETYEAGWDGNINGGSKAAPGVYFYSITATGFDGNVYEMEGAFHLMRE